MLKKLLFVAVLVSLLLSSAQAAKIIWVTETVDRNEDGIQDDQQWIDYLTDAGYEMDVQMDHWLTLGDDKDPNDANDYVAELNAADIVIISRTASSGGYASDANEVAAWASVTSPIMSLSAWHVRDNRLKWVSSTTVNRTLDTYLWALEPDHAVFANVPLEDDLVEAVTIDGFPDGYQGNCVIGGLDVGNGTLIGQTFSDEMFIAEFPAGVEEYEGAGVVQAGVRFLLCAGTENASTTANLIPQGAWNLTEAGEQIFANAVAYLVDLAAPSEIPGPVHSYTFEDGTPNDCVGTADGTLVGGAAVVDGAMVTSAQEDWMEMPGDVIDINSFDEVTIEAWYTPTAGANTSWSMLAYFGGSTDPDPSAGLGRDGFFMTSARGDDVSRGAISTGNSTDPWATETGVNGPELDDGLLHHMVFTINATQIAFYIDGELQGTAALSEANKLSAVSNNYALLAKGGYGGDPEWIGSIDEFNIYNVALTTGAVGVLYEAGPSGKIRVANASFELPGTVKQNTWDGGTNAKGTFEDVPGWSSDAMATDSGVETGWSATDGEWTGFLKGADASIWQLTDYVLAADDVLTLSLDARITWAATQLTISLYVLDDAGARVPVATEDVALTDDMQTATLTLSAADAPDAVGKQIGIEINNTSDETESWAGIDNVQLSH